jgi:glyoxylase-like metal-dependent hydrolase (beta-lactamase superfamily II)
VELNGRWIELADGVLARRYERLDQTLGLVIGERRCLVIDTGCDEVHGAEFATAIRRVTALPWDVVITHAHFDHHFGTGAFTGTDASVWAHRRCRDALVQGAETDRAQWVEQLRHDGHHVLADRLAAARLVLPDRLVDDREEIDLGGRTVSLMHPGVAHTDHDLTVHVPSADVLFAGDLVEQGAPPAVGPDAFPTGWPGALDTLLALRPGTVVPGHGEPVDAAFVRAQRDGLADA